METASITTPLAAAAVGLVTGLHCAGMCGPLSIAMVAKPGEPISKWRGLLGYHVSRVISYTLLGAVMGAIGKPASIFFESSPAHLIPWIFAGLFLIIGLGLDRWIPQPKFFSQWIFKWGMKTCGTHSSKWLGLFTPLIPCGPLYLVLGAALLAGSWSQGALLMLAFALGTVPVYVFLQSQLILWRHRLSPGALQVIRQSLALIAAGMIIWRALAGEGLEATECPMCRGHK